MDKTIGINTQENDLQIGQTAPDFSEPPLSDIFLNRLNKCLIPTDYRRGDNNISIDMYALRAKL